MEDTDNQQNNSKRVIGKPFPKGVSGNPLGRPKGSTLKEYQAQKFREMSEEDKEEYLKDIAKVERWRMAEGNPESKTDVTTKGDKINTLDPRIIELTQKYEEEIKKGLDVIIEPS